MAQAPQPPAQQQQQTPHEAFKKFPLEPHHEVGETFVNQIGLTTFDNSGLHMELAVARMDEMRAGGTPTGKRHVVCRLVMSPQCVIDLINQMQKITAQLVQMGLVKVDQPSVPVQPTAKTN
jgi:hypothetical protein